MTDYSWILNEETDEYYLDDVPGFSVRVHYLPPVERIDVDNDWFWEVVDLRGLKRKKKEFLQLSQSLPPSFESDLQVVKFGYSHIRSDDGYAETQEAAQEAAITALETMQQSTSKA